MTQTLHTPEFLADVTQPGPNGITFHAMPWPDAVEPQAVTTALMYDGITASAVPQGPYIAYYFNGTFANGTAMRADHPHAVAFVSITPNGDKGAWYLDVEPGDATNDMIAAFLKAGGHGFYTSAGNVQAAIDACDAAGLKRGSYAVWSAHWTGQHICAPATCGFPQADGTQFASNASFDTSLIMPATFLPAAPLPPSPANPYNLSVTPHTAIHAAWNPVPGADHYPAVFTPSGGGKATEVEVPEPATGAVHMPEMLLPPDSHGTLTINAIVNSKAVLVGTRTI